MLLFKKKFLQAIREGKKTQTIRLWRYARMRAGQRSYIPGVGYVSIDVVEAVALERLCDEDARPDGFPSADALREELRAIYPEELKSGYAAFRVCFSVLPPEEQKRLTDERKKKKEAEKAKKEAALEKDLARKAQQREDAFEDTMKKLRLLTRGESVSES